MKRRNFIYLIGASSIVLLSPFINCSSSITLRGVLSIPESLSRIHEEKLIKELGLIYRNMFPSEAYKNQLELLLLKENSNKNLSIRAISKFIKEEITKDFIEINTVIINGWILSRTEARQCALYSLDS